MPESRGDLLEQLGRARKALRHMSEVGKALMSERDRDALYDLILTHARSLSGSDAGSLYLVEDETDPPVLRFITSQVDTLPDLPSLTFRLPLDRTSIAGYAATGREVLVIDDVYDLPDDVPYSFNREAFDEKHGYRAKSMLVVPMIDHRDHVVGVLQLINRKRNEDAAIRTDQDSDRWVLPYTEREVDIVLSVAGQAAVAIENGKLYRRIENLLEGFMKAAVTAIDQRDPATSGHSLRVTELTCRMAELIDAQIDGPFAEVRFSDAEMKQLRYAGLLHDVGKIGVPEEILVKQNKLPPVLQAEVRSRFARIEALRRLQAAEERAEAVAAAGGSGSGEELEVIERSLAEDLERIERYRQAVEEANTPRILAEDAAAVLEEIGAANFVDVSGEVRPYLSEGELHFLRIRKGSLDESERLKIQSHVVHSHDFLLGIPWTEELSRVASIVRGHHEKLDGTGYPDGKKADELSIETRIMTVCDIFDALTASDRPYKKAMPIDRALGILENEAELGMLDADVVRLFVDSEVYRSVLDAG
jgi:HD-GYP domain-containing protein (c-di-GMP phosphodiesterase class II)